SEDIAAGLARVSAAGGKAEFITVCPTLAWGHTWPSRLPDGRHFLFMARDWTRSAENSAGGIYVGSLDSRETKRLLPDHSNAAYVAPGYLVFHRGGQLVAAPFDASALAVTGEAIPL